MSDVSTSPSSSRMKIPTLQLTDSSPSSSLLSADRSKYTQTSPADSKVNSYAVTKPLPSPAFCLTPKASFDFAPPSPNRASLDDSQSESDDDSEGGVKVPAVSNMSTSPLHGAVDSFGNDYAGFGWLSPLQGPQRNRNHRSPFQAQVLTLEQQAAQTAQRLRGESDCNVNSNRRSFAGIHNDPFTNENTWATNLQAATANFQSATLTNNSTRGAFSGQDARERSSHRTARSLPTNLVIDSGRSVESGDYATEVQYSSKKVQHFSQDRQHEESYNNRAAASNTDMNGSPTPKQPTQIISRAYWRPSISSPIAEEDVLSGALAVSASNPALCRPLGLEGCTGCLETPTHVLEPCSHGTCAFHVRSWFSQKKQTRGRDLFSCAFCFRIVHQVPQKLSQMDRNTASQSDYTEYSQTDTTPQDPCNISSKPIVRPTKNEEEHNPHIQSRGRNNRGLGTVSPVIYKHHTIDNGLQDSIDAAQQYHQPNLVSPLRRRWTTDSASQANDLHVNTVQRRQLYQPENSSNFQNMNVQDVSGSASAVSPWVPDQFRRHSSKPDQAEPFMQSPTQLSNKSCHQIPLEGLGQPRPASGQERGPFVRFNSSDQLQYGNFPNNAPLAWQQCMPGIQLPQTQIECAAPLGMQQSHPLPSHNLFGPYHQSPAQFLPSGSRNAYFQARPNQYPPNLAGQQTHHQMLQQYHTPKDNPSGQFHGLTRSNLQARPSYTYPPNVPVDLGHLRSFGHFPSSAKAALPVSCPKEGPESTNRHRSTSSGSLRLFSRPGVLPYPIQPPPALSIQLQRLLSDGVIPVDIACDISLGPFNHLGSQRLHAFGVLLITNLPYEVTKAQVFELIGDTSKTIDDHGTPIHILMERHTAKTLDCYVEFISFAEAMNFVNACSNRKSMGHPPRIGERIIGVELSSQDMLMKSLFPNARNISWAGGHPRLIENTQNELSGSTFRGFITEEELLHLAKHAERPDGNYHCQRSKQRPYENMISVLQKFPWQATHFVTVGARDSLFETTLKMMHSLELALLNPNRDSVLNMELFESLVTAGLNAPGFTEQQRVKISEHGNFKIPFTDLSQAWPFQALGRKSDVPEDVVAVFATYLHHATIPTDNSFCANSDSISQLSHSPFGAINITLPRDRDLITMKEAAKFEWEIVTSLLRRALINQSFE